MADDTSETETGLEDSEATKAQLAVMKAQLAEFSTKFEAAFSATMEKLQSSMICRLAKNKEPRRECVLGPHYSLGMPPAINEVLENSLVDTSCLTGGASWSSWNTNSKQPGSWPKSTPEWKKWVPRMEHFFGCSWKKFGIYDSIKTSEQEIYMDRPLLAAALCFWSSATNTMDLPLGPMSPTLLDMAAIFGFRPNGEEICALADLPSSFHASLKPKVNKDDKKAKQKADAKARKLLNYSTFYAEHAIAEDVSTVERHEPTQHEHAAFLLYWLCKYVFCTKSNKCLFEFAGIAEALSLGKPLALGPFVLAYLYHTLRNVVTNDMTLDVGGPLWMFQVWVQTYFRQLRPSHPFDSTVILGRQIISLGPHAHSVVECFAFFLSKKSMTKEEFAICYSRDYPSCLALNITRPWERSLDLSVLLPWGSILISRDINYGLKGTLGRPGVEVYLPNFVARQLGFIQSCPAFFLMSRNRFSSWRGGFTDTAHCSAVTLYYQTQFGNFERSGLSAREPDHRATPTFQTWWSTFIKKKFGEDLRTTERIALYGFPGLFTNKGNGKKKPPVAKSKSKEMSKEEQTSKKRGLKSGRALPTKKVKKSPDVVESSVTNLADIMVSEDIIFEGDMDNSQNALAENHITSGAEDAAETSDASNNNTGSADSEGSPDKAQSENFEHERDGRIDHSSHPPESSMVEIDMDDLGENQLPNIDQLLANSANLAKDAEDISVLGREALPNHQTLVPVRGTQSSSTLELVLLNPTELNPSMSGMLTSPLTERMPRNDQAIICAPSSAEPVDQTTGDLGMELLQFLDTLDNNASPMEEKLETTETKKALESVRQFLGCDTRAVTEASFLAFKEAVEVLISANHLSQVEAYEVHALLSRANFSLSPYLEAQKEFETGEKSMSEYKDIRQSTDLGQLHKLKTSLDEGRQKVRDLKKQLVEAEEQVKITSASIRTIVPQQDLTRYSLILSSVKSYNKKKCILKRKVDQGMEDLEKVKEVLRSLLPSDK
ncbi:uncharacterized protein LOC121051653 [Rosa chinensis]|nr:uncharacterized protein LOC121051653 [Rosa chinensis]